MVIEDDKAKRARLALQAAEGFSRAARLRRESKTRSAQGRARIREGQRENIARLHAGELADASTAQAARFFLSDIYPPETQPWRDGLTSAALPSLGKLLPMDALAALAAAAELDAATEEADALSAAAWPAPSWEQAYLAAGLAARERQIEALREAGRRLGAMSSNRFARPALAAMRLPAKLAGLGDLQSFLERGLAAFESLRDPAGFADALADRELAWARELFKPRSAPDGSSLSSPAPTA